MKQAYIDNVDGKIDDDLFTRLTADYRNDERQILRQLGRLMDADHAYIDRGNRADLNGAGREAHVWRGRVRAEAKPARDATFELHLQGGHSDRELPQTF